MPLHTDSFDMETGAARLGDTGLHVEFYDREVVIQPNPNLDRYNPDKRIEVFCRIQTPGDKTLTWDQPVRDSDKQRFPRHWLAYTMSKDNSEAPAIGVPLIQWNTDDPESFNQNQMIEMQALRFQTVEQIAAMTDMQMQKVGMGAAGLKVKATAYLTARNRSQDSRELEKTRGELSEMKEQLAALMAKLTADQTLPELGKVMADASDYVQGLPEAPIGLTPAQARMAKARAARKVNRGEQHASPTGAASHG